MLSLSLTLTVPVLGAVFDELVNFYGDVFAMGAWVRVRSVYYWPQLPSVTYFANKMGIVR